MYQNTVIVLPYVLCLRFFYLASAEQEPYRDAKARVRVCSSVRQNNRDIRTADGSVRSCINHINHV